MRLLLAKDLLTTPYASPRAREAYRAEHGLWYPLTASCPVCDDHHEYYRRAYENTGL
ncbi:hypothetical protein GT354_15525, partial [Streptomyces sp. SID3343]|nr:hypothetical protein [Streptomyces sp. SID3343]